MGTSRKRIGEILVLEGLVTAADVDKALAVQKAEGGRIVEILVRLGCLDVLEFGRFLARQPGIPSVDLKRYQIDEKLGDLIPYNIAMEYEVFPLDRLKNLLTLAMAFPLDQNARVEVEELTGLKVKPVLCNAQDIRDAIERHYGGGRRAADTVTKADRLQTAYTRGASPLRMSSIVTMIRKIDDLPALPETVHKVQRAIENPDVSLKDVAKLLENDPLISARLLKLVNSAAYGLPNRINDVSASVNLLGLDETARLVLSTSALSVLEKSGGFNFGQFWREAQFCAAAAKGISEWKGERPHPALHAAGLLHDIGRFALSHALGSHYKEIEQGLIGDHLIRAEVAMFGIDHAEAGHELARHWGFPSDLAHAIRFHHAPLRAKRDGEVVCAVAVASFMAECYQSETPLEKARTPEIDGAMAALGASLEDAAAVYELTVDILGA